jgi:hypothetical protein
MKTIEDIIKDSVPHPLVDDARQTIYFTPSLKISIVGGGRGLYGDFNETFEIAIIDKDTSNFISGYFYPEFSDSYGETMTYLDREQTLKVVNELIKK